MTVDPIEPDPICERCWLPLAPGDVFVRLGHVVGSQLTGDITWAYTYLHHYDAEVGACVPAPRSTSAPSC